MEHDENSIPLRVAYLMAPYISRSLNAAEQTELDKWVTSSTDNQKTFESYIERGILDETKGNLEMLQNLQYIAELIIKKLKGTINEQGKKTLQEWAALSPANKTFLESLPETGDTKLLSEHLRWRLLHDNLDQRLN